MRTERVMIVALTLGVVTLALRPAVPAAVATGEDETFNLAVCAVPTIVNELMASERFAEAREDLADDFEDQRKDLEERLEQISEQAQGMEPDDPALPAMGQEFNEIRQELFRLRSEFETDSTALQARHLAESYELARASAVAIGEELGYDFVIASGSPDEDLNKTDSAALLGQLSRRPMLKFPENHDITDDVRDDLNL